MPRTHNVTTKEKGSCIQCQGHVHLQEALTDCPLNTLYIGPTKQNLTLTLQDKLGVIVKAKLVNDGKLNMADKDI